MRKAIKAQIVRYNPNPAFRIDYDDGSFDNFTKQCSPDVAKIRLSKIRDQIELGTFELKDHTRHKSKLITLENFFRKALIHFNQQINLKRITQKTVNHRADTFAIFTNVIGKKQLVSTLSTEHIDTFFTTLIERGTQYTTTKQFRPYSPSTLKSYKGDLHVAWEWAVKKGYAKSNPFHGYTIGTDTQQGQDEIRILSPNEQQRVINYFDDLKTVWKPFAFYIAKDVGARRGEIFNLKDTSLFYHDVPNLGTIPGLKLFGKGSKTRYVPIDDITHQRVLDRIELIKDPEKVEDILFTSNFKRAHYESKRQRAKEGYLLFEVSRPEAITEAFYKIFKACDIPNAHFHDLRKTFATEGVTEGLSFEAMRDFLGHTNVTTTQKHYAFVEFDRLAREMDRLKVGNS